VAALFLALTLSDDALLVAAGAVGYTVCHQLPEHSLHMAGEQLPLCARCTGIYLGFLVGLLGLAFQGKLRAALLPPGPIVGLLLATLALMGLDGFNSLIGLLRDTPVAYETTNLLRLATGTAAGTSVALLLVPLLNDSLWAKPEPSASVDDLGDLVGYAVLAALAVALANSEHPALLYPTALASSLGVIVALSAAGATLSASLMPGKAQRKDIRSAARPLLIGLALAAAAMLAVGSARAYFSLTLGL